MLTWCADAQERHLVAGMLPFNGDETYVAGGMLPRSALDDGSAEATLLYVASVTQLNDWCTSRGCGNSDEIARRQRKVEETWRQYRMNFFEGPRLMLNNPQRVNQASLPRFRHGVCQGRLVGCHFFGWSERSADGRYACPGCFPKMQYQTKESDRFFLPSVAATPAFINFLVAEPNEQAAMIDAALLPFTSATGEICCPDVSLPGYELGLLLYALADAGHPQTHEVAKRLLELRDPTGAWVEYYSGRQPSGTRYRPWESGMNLCGLIHAVKRGL